MAQYWDEVGSFTTRRILSQSQSVKVQGVQLYTKPSRIYMVVLVPYDSWTKDAYAKYLEPPVLLTEQLMGNDLGVAGDVTALVTNARQVQETDASRLLSYFMVYTVSYTPDTVLSFPFTEDVTVPMTAIETFAAFSEPIEGGKTAQQLILAAYNRVKKAAAA